METQANPSLALMEKYEFLLSGIATPTFRDQFPDRSAPQD
jgi:hypothetical protein